MPTTIPRFLLATALLVLAGGNARSATIDGSLEPAYGAPRSTQINQTSFIRDGSICATQPDSVTFSSGSELDGAYAYVDGDVLYVFLTGNLSSCWFGEVTYVQHYLEVFIDSKPGGQNVLRGDNAAVGYRPNALNRMAGLTFDHDFEPDYWLNSTIWVAAPHVYAYYAELASAGGGPGWFLGQTAAGGPGVLSGGTNPEGIRVTVNDSNKLGVTGGCGPASGANVTTGYEWAIPLAAIGNPTGCVKINAMVDCGDWCNPFVLSNQMLGPLPPGTCDLGKPAGVDLNAFSGDQFFTVCFGATPARRTSWGSLKLIYR